MEGKTKILILTKENSDIALNIDNATIQIERTKNFDDILRKLDKELYDSYDFILLRERNSSYNYIGHYFPLNIEKANRNQAYINEILYNSTIINNIKYLIDEKYNIQIGIMIRHIIRKDVTYNDFNFNKEIKYISKFNKYNKKDSKTLKQNIYEGIKYHYSQNSFLRKIRFRLNRNRIVKQFLFKVYNIIIEDTKKNTEINLVFKELVSIIK